MVEEYEVEVQNENFVEHRSHEPVINQNEDELLEQNQEREGNTFENHKFRKEKISL